MKKFCFIIISCILFVGCSDTDEIKTLNTEVLDLENTIIEFEKIVSDYEIVIAEKNSTISSYEEQKMGNKISSVELIKHILLNIKILEEYSDERIHSYENDSSRLSNLLYGSLGDLYKELWYNVGDEERFYVKIIAPFIESDYSDINILIVQAFESLGYYYNRISCIESDIEGVTQTDVKEAYNVYLEVYSELTEAVNALTD